MHQRGRCESGCEELAIGPHAILSYDHKKLETIICLVLESVINRDVERNAAGLKAGEPSSSSSANKMLEA
ncbi:hypothetical protein MCOR02_003183 [Pyricularia oryzae]|uniref:Uncharacterized protein n=3 Tax=Pyricularia oryzae TaxID=318829 RepID=G4MTM8_PYRO7|nr:uncharacterized protein MGG_15872 [Pyricularia oryzae 70-15]ELQ38301.1 hypothetical protein OOU_Y34scaffold00545g5 [Pyricularia oryzae Y34]KAH8839782.1 hypothetical protein MCOR01_008958 [Pyricularia oryzae]EHA55586.1 hypothetical protein MGG_15872 [Pyricularia oryzae 70-15]KAH9439643.1 hypothetical protein MCOR02_003183 [Pyricularia oryzae]KAI6312481.1 hypothetical protein MCOR34_005597 [Pyricularia oryzae]